jgi:hypothetical protein
MPLIGGSSLPSQVAFHVLSGGAAFVAAVLSWNVYEKRFLQLKRFFQ